jgi:hypothetical protein
MFARIRGFNYTFGEKISGMQKQLAERIVAEGVPEEVKHVLESHPRMTRSRLRACSDEDMIQPM